MAIGCDESRKLIVVDGVAMHPGWGDIRAVHRQPDPDDFSGAKSEDLVPGSVPAGKRLLTEPIPSKAISPIRIRLKTDMWAPRQSLHFRRPDTGFTTWREMCGNGAQTGIVGMITSNSPGA